MNAEQAIKRLSEVVWDYPAVLVLEEAVLDLIQTSSDGLQEWLGNGDYDGSETVRSIAAEWDALVE